jgi:hypothetical protein
VLLYPGPDARNLSAGGLTAADLGGRTLLVFLLDSTWSGARKMLRLSPSLQRLPRVMFISSSPSRYVIKQQPQEGCLSTLEATHEMLRALGLFQRMQDFQLRCAADPALAGYRRKAYTPAAVRVPTIGPASRRRRYVPLAPPRTDTSS